MIKTTSDEGVERLSCSLPSQSPRKTLGTKLELDRIAKVCSRSKPKYANPYVPGTKHDRYRHMQ